MKDIRPALRAFLLADPTVSGMVGGARIHYGRLPQGQTDPSVVFNKVAEIPDYVMTGDSRLSQARMQFDAWSLSTDSATQLAGAVYDRLTGQKGDMPYDAVLVTVRGLFLASGRDDYDSVARMFRCSRDYLVWYLI